MGRIMIPFGTEPEEYDFTKGTIIMYDTFDNLEFNNLKKLINLAEERKFDRIIVYPLHETTAQRMDIGKLHYSYKDRVKAIDDFILHIDTDVFIQICKLEGKRSKYTPIDTALSFICEHHKGPYFLWMPDYIANSFSTYSTFDKWIREIRLIISKETSEPIKHKLQDKNNRWEWF